MRPISPTDPTTDRVAQNLTTPGQPLRIVSVAELPTRFGDFRAVAFTPDADGNEHLAIVRGTVRDLRACDARPLRVPDRRRARIAALRLP